MKESKQSRLEKFFLWLWYESFFTAKLLLPLSYLFLIVSKFRKKSWQEKARHFPVPIVVIGNITVGGTGKTPVIIALANALKNKGVSVGIISRGYGSQFSQYPQSVFPSSDPNLTGDEPLLIARATNVPLVIDADRIKAVQFLLEHYPETDIILSDDGLQHYRLSRDFEIVLVDGERGWGNGHLLPAGPLRESIMRINDADWVLINGENSSVNESIKIPSSEISIQPSTWLQLSTQKRFVIDKMPLHHKGLPVVITGIGNPNRFFKTLDAMGVKYQKKIVFDDHYAFKPEDFDSLENDTILMTTKDGVKCEAFAQDNWFALEVTPIFDDQLINTIIQLIKSD